MSGRLEKDLEIEMSIKNIIKDKSQVLIGYSKSFGQKTSNTKKVYISYVLNFCTYLNQEFQIDINNLKDLKLLNYSHIVSYLDYIQYHKPDGTFLIKENSSCASELYAIKHFCKYLKLCKYIDDNPCIELEIPKDRKNHQIVSLSTKEINIIKNNIINGVGSHKAKETQKKWISRDLCIVFLGLTTGLRVSAIANIDITDINFKEKYITTIEKGGIERVIYLSDKMLDLIHDWLLDREKLLTNNNITCQALFVSAKKQRIGVNTIRDMLKKYTYNIDKHITPHKLRSTAATNLYEQTADIYLVADVLGHKNIQNTRRYAQISDNRRKQAADQLSKLI